MKAITQKALSWVHKQIKPEERLEQMITDLEIEGMEKDMAITDLEIAVMELQAQKTE